MNSSFYGAAVAELQKRWGHLELLVVRRLPYKSHILMWDFKKMTEFGLVRSIDFHQKLERS